MSGADNPNNIRVRIATLALPIVAYNLIEMSLGLVDLFMVRDYGVVEVATSWGVLALISLTSLVLGIRWLRLDRMTPTL